MKKALAISTLAATLAIPLVSLAEVKDFTSAGSYIVDLINDTVIPVLFALAFVVFLWGAFTTFILGANNDVAKEKGKGFMLYGIIGLFVMLSAWGLVSVLDQSLGLDDKTPTLPTSGIITTSID